MLSKFCCYHTRCLFRTKAFSTLTYASSSLSSAYAGYVYHMSIRNILLDIVVAFKFLRGVARHWVSVHIRLPHRKIWHCRVHSVLNHTILEYKTDKCVQNETDGQVANIACICWRHWTKCQQKFRNVFLQNKTKQNKTCDKGCWHTTTSVLILPSRATTSEPMKRLWTLPW